MKANIFEIFNKEKSIGILPGKFVNKSNLHEEHLLLSDTYSIKPGYIIIANKCEKFYVTDVRLHHSTEHKLEVYYETEGEYIKQQKQRQHNWHLQIFSTISGAIAGFITSIIFWLITK